jgi:hypothetical protein
MLRSTLAEIRESALLLMLPTGIGRRVRVVVAFS